MWAEMATVQELPIAAMWTQAEACAVLRIGRNTLKRMIARGEVRTVRVAPKCVRIPAEEIDRLMAGVERSA